MDESGHEGHQVVAVKFEELNPKDKAERAQKVAEDYYATVEGRVDAVVASGLDPVKALAIKSDGVGKILAMLGGVSMDMTAGMIEKAAILADDGKPNETDAQLLEKLSKLRFGMMFTPENRPHDEVGYAKEYWRAIEFDLGCQMAELIVDKYPEWKKVAEERNGRNLRSSLNDSEEKLPQHVQMALEMHAMMGLMREDGQDANERLMNERVATLKYMTQGITRYVLGETFTMEERRRVEDILDYGDGLNLSKGLLLDMAMPNKVGADRQ